MSNAVNLISINSKNVQQYQQTTHNHLLPTSSNDSYHSSNINKPLINQNQPVIITNLSITSNTMTNVNNTCAPTVPANIPTTTTTSSNTSSNPSKQIFNASTIKLLQRLLDEASQTGDLILNNKHLNEFPSKLAINYDLSDTITADLSKNNLTEFPKELCHYDSLEKLTLYYNLIRTIPEMNHFQLKCLKILDLNSNNLSYLPPSLCNLASLQVLTINNNKLVSLPEEIGRLDKLIQLDVSCNEITHLPVQIGDMSSLRSLNVRRNLLVELPKEISHLKLVNFDCSSNRLSKLPLCFREMVTLIDLVVDHNPLEVPPAHICTKGLLHIMKYLLVEAIKEEKKRGILTEYEINSQYNSFNNGNNSYTNLSTNTSNQLRLSCNGIGGIGFGSFMFQSSVRNMCKKLSMPSSSISTVSTSSSSSSSSTTSSSSSLNKQTKSLMQITSQQQTPTSKTNNQTSPYQLPTSNNQSPATPSQNLSSNNQISPSSSSASSSSTSSTPTPTNTFNFNNNINSNNNNNKNDIILVDYLDAASTSSPSSSSSSCSSSSSPQTSNQNPLSKLNLNCQTMNKTESKPVTIHDLISLKSPANTNGVDANRNQLNLLKCNQNGVISSSNNNSNEFESEHQHQEQHQQQIWLLNHENIESSRKLHEEKHHLQQQLILKAKQKLILNNHQQQQILQQNFDNNFSIVSGLSLNANASSTTTTNLNPIINMKTISSANTTINNKRLTSDCQYEKNMISSSYNNINNLARNIYSSNGVLNNSSGSSLIDQNTHHHHQASNFSNNNNIMVNNKPPIIPYHKSNHLQSSDVQINSIVYDDESYNQNNHVNNSFLVNNNSNQINDLNNVVDESCYLLNDETGLINEDMSKYYKYQSQQQQQQIWVPREDTLQNQLHLINNQSNNNGNNLLCNGKDTSCSDLENINPAFTIRRHFLQIQEEQKQIETLKKSIETKLKIQLPSTSSIDELGVSLSDGVVLCHLINQIFPRAVQIIHVPSLAVPKLSLAKCRKNVENFIEACRRLGLPENDLCCAQDIIEAKNTVKIARTVIMLVNYNQFFQQHQMDHHQNIDYRQAIAAQSNITTIGNAMSMNHNQNSANMLSQPPQQQQQTAV